MTNTKPATYSFRVLERIAREIGEVYRGYQIQSILLDAKAPLPDNFATGSKWWMVNETFKGIRRKYLKSDDEISKLIMEFLDPRNHGLDKEKTLQFQNKIKEIIELGDTKNTTIGKDFLIFSDDNDKVSFDELNSISNEPEEDPFAFLDNYSDEEITKVFKDDESGENQKVETKKVKEVFQNLVKVAELKNTGEIISNFNKQNFVELSKGEKIYMLKVLYSYFEAVITTYRGNGMFFISNGIDDLNDCYKILRKKILEIVNSDEIFTELKNTDEYKTYVEENKNLYSMSEYLDVLWDDAVLPALIYIREEIADKDLFENDRQIHSTNQITVDFLNLINKEIQNFNKILALQNKRFDETYSSKNTNEFLNKEKTNNEGGTIKHEHKHFHEGIIPTKPLQMEIVNEVAIKTVEDGSLPKGQSKIYPPKFPPTEWSKITIKFIDSEEVFISTKNNGKQEDGKHTNYEALGFKNLTKNKPNKKWEFLLLLSITDGFYKIEGNIPEKFRKLKSDLSQTLQKIFKNRTDPFDDPSHSGGYKILINLIPPPEYKNIKKNVDFEDE